MSKPLPGTALRDIYRNFGFSYGHHCECKAVKEKMDEMGVEWCQENITWIVEQIKKEARRRGLAVLTPVCMFSVKMALKLAERRASGELTKEEILDAQSQVREEARGAEETEVPPPVPAVVETKSQASPTVAPSAPDTKLPAPSQPAGATPVPQSTVPVQTNQSSGTDTKASALPGGGGSLPAAPTPVVPPSPNPATADGAAKV